MRAAGIPPRYKENSMGSVNITMYPGEKRDEIKVSLEVSPAPVNTEMYICVLEVARKMISLQIEKSKKSLAGEN
jgi:hypothetical protein